MNKKPNVTVEIVEPKGLEMMGITSVIEGEHFQLGGDILKKISCVHEAANVPRRGVDRKGVIHEIDQSAKVHPRPDIDEWLAAQKPEEAPMAETVACGQIKIGGHCFADGKFVALLSMTHISPERYHFRDATTGEFATILRDDWDDHTIEAANVTIKAERVYKDAAS